MVRLRLFLALITMFLIPIAIAAPMVYGLAVGFGASKDCRVVGIRLAADDVGAGNAGLRLLSQLRFDIVKIDLSLVQGGAVHAASLEVVKTLRDLADRWGALVVAEGIETPAQLDIVRSLGIGAGQGYLLGRPTDRPSTEPIDLEKLSRSSDWLIDRLRVMPT